MLMKMMIVMETMVIVVPNVPNGLWQNFLVFGKYMPESRRGSDHCQDFSSDLAKCSDHLYHKKWPPSYNIPEKRSSAPTKSKHFPKKLSFTIASEKGNLYKFVAKSILSFECNTLTTCSHHSKLAGSPFREELNKGILKMQEFGRMEMLYKKWIGLPGSECASQQDGLIGWLSGML